MEVTERDVPAHRSVQEGIREEEMALGGGKGAGCHLQGSQRLWLPPGYGDLLPISGAGDIGGGQQLAGGGQEIFTGEVSV